MPEISNKKRKFIKRNFAQLSLEELTRHTGLTPHVVKSLIDEYSSEKPGKDRHTNVGKWILRFPSWKIILFTFLLFAVIALVTYSPSLQGEFVFDDAVIKNSPLLHLTRVSQLTDLLFSKEHGRRIGFMSFALNYYFGGLDPFGYHLVNVIIHIFNGLTLFLLSYTILTLPSGAGKGKSNALTIAFLGSLIWLTHPIQTQAVSYIVQRLTSLSSLFFLLSLLCYIKGRMNHSHKRLVLFSLSLLLGLLALGTKQNAATLPIFIIVSEFLFLQQHPLTMDRKRVGVIILAGGLFIIIAWIYLGHDSISRLALGYEKRGWTPLERVLTQLRVVIFYLSLLIFPRPSRLNLDHDFSLSHSLLSPPSTFLSLLVLMGFISLAIFFIKRNRLVSFAIFWFFGNLVIESSFIPLEMVFEHRLYLPSMSLIVLVIAFFFSVLKREWKKWGIALLVPFILLFSYWTYERASVWKDPISLWRDASKKSPNKARPHCNIAVAFTQKGMLDEAIAECKKALDIDPNFAKAHNNLGYAHFKKGKSDEAIMEIKHSLAIDPTYVEAYNNLGTIYGIQGGLDEAVAEFEKALVINPYYAKAHNNLGNAYYKKGALEKAMAAYKQAIALESNYAEAHNNLSVIYYSRNNYKLSLVHCDKAMELGFHVNPAFLELLKPYR